MEFPEFFAAAPQIAVRDPLAKFLGAASDGVIEYQYADVVKLAGHSCPTVASAYLMTRRALKALYPDALPVRGEIRLELRDERTAGATGVIANVASFLTGATQWCVSIGYVAGGRAQLATVSTVTAATSVSRIAGMRSITPFMLAVARLDRRNEAL